MISVIIPMYNAEGTIEKCINSLTQQTFKDYEIIVVNDNSTDDSINIIKKYKKIKIISLKENVGAGTARDIGANNSKGKILAFTDSDCILPKDWLEKINNDFKKKDIVGVAGTYNESEGKSFIELFSFYELIYRREGFPEFINTASSSNFACLKSIYKKAGGFKTLFKTFTAEDMDLSYRISKIGKIYWDKENGIKHHFPTKIKSYLKKQFKYARDTSIITKKYPNLLKNKICQGDNNKLIIPLAALSLILLLGGAIYHFLLIPFILSIIILLLIDNKLLIGMLKKCGIWSFIKSIFIIYMRDLIWVFGILNGFFKRYEN